MIRSASTEVANRVSFTDGECTAHADIPKLKGGAGLGFGPHDLLEAALATCIAITVELYAAKHGIPLESVEAVVRIDRSQPGDAVLNYSLDFRGSLTDEQRNLLRVAASKCPVQRTLTGKLTCRAEGGRDGEGA